MKMTIDFMEPERLHSNSDTLTTADLAKILESKYKLVQKFTQHIESRLMSRITQVISRFIEKGVYKEKSLEKMLNQQVGGWLQNEWRNYINSGIHGIKTQISKKQERQSFVDTGDYFKSMIAYIKVS